MWAETGLHLVNASPYRSYQTQKNLYARYRTQYSEATTDRFSARAGYSEHQTGLALDVIAPGGTRLFLFCRKAAGGRLIFLHNRRSIPRT